MSKKSLEGGRERAKLLEPSFFIMVMGVSESTNFLNNQSHHQEMIEGYIAQRSCLLFFLLRL